MALPPIDRPALVRHLREQASIRWMGHHGIRHWMRVRANGLLLCRLNGANALVVELFAFFHDSRRVNEGVDEGHGERGAQLACQLHGRLFHASTREMDLLVQACTTHSDGGMHGELTVRTCWDADRLDLGRVGVEPDPRRLSTAEARLPQVLATARERWRRVERR